MEATVKIDGKDVRFKATAAVPMLYRKHFNRDLFRDLQSTEEKEDDKSLIQTQETMERMAYTMAKHADPGSVPDTLAEWMEDLPPMAVYAFMPIITALWSGDVNRLEEAKKKEAQLIESLQHLFSFSGLSSSESPSGT